MCSQLIEIMQDPVTPLCFIAVDPFQISLPLGNIFASNSAALGFISMPGNISSEVRRGFLQSHQADTLTEDLS